MRTLILLACSLAGAAFLAAGARAVEPVNGTLSGQAACNILTASFVAPLK